MWRRGGASFWQKDHYLNKLGRGLLGDITNIKALRPEVYALRVQTRRYLYIFSREAYIKHMNSQGRAIFSPSVLTWIQLVEAH